MLMKKKRYSRDFQIGRQASAQNQIMFYQQFPY